MDRALYVAMSGAMQTQAALAVNANNLANASTTGFRAQLAEAQAVPVDGAGLPSRVNVRIADPGWDSTGGSIQHTGRELDVALKGDSWMAVQDPSGNEAYTKAGDLSIDLNGQLRTGSGLAVLGDGGPLTVPPSSQLVIGNDGTVSIVPQGQSAATQAVVGRIKTVSATQSQLSRGADGLFRSTPGVSLDPAVGDVMTSGALESSNVSLPNAMVNMIQLSRQFELQTKLMHATEDNASAASSLVRMSS